jgi:cupin 2 domain-containing protein
VSRTVHLPSNLFVGVPDGTPGEVATTLAAAPHVRVERIVSRGHASPDGFWYDQDRAEWVLVLTGAARLRFEGDDRPVEMKPGDWVNIPAHRRHRVEWTTPDEPTVWLAVFYDEAKGIEQTAG